MDGVSPDITHSDEFAPIQVKVYKRRWWIIFLFAGLGFMQEQKGALQRACDPYEAEAVRHSLCEIYIILEDVIGNEIFIQPYLEHADASTVYNPSRQLLPLFHHPISKKVTCSISLILLSFKLCAIWNTWGPITASVKKAYPSWDDAEIGLLSMWGTITMMIGLIPFMILVQRKGMRTGMLLTSGLIAAGSTVRILNQDEKNFTILAHLGAILNGFGGIVIGAAPSLLSSIWFPQNERTTATGIGCTFNQLGNAGGFFLGPWIVRLPEGKNASFGKSDDMDIAEIKRSIKDYMWITAGLCISFFIFVLAYFPDKPKRPPTLTSAIHHTGNTLKEDVKLILRNKNFWILAVPYSLTLGVNVAWSSVIDINVAPMGITQNEASFIGIYMTIGGVVLALIVSRMTDWLFGYIKLTIMGLITVATVNFTWFLFLMNGCLPFDKNQIFVSAILGSSFSYACSPLFFELAVELAFPVPEGIVGGFLTMFWNLTAAAFLGILQLEVDTVLWMDYLLAIQGVIALIFMIFVKEEYKRSSLDKTPNATVDVEDDDEEPLLSDMFRSINSSSSNII